MGEIRYPDRDVFFFYVHVHLRKKVPAQSISKLLHVYMQALLVLAVLLPGLFPSHLFSFS